jgi:hypothetical protein
MVVKTEWVGLVDCWWVGKGLRLEICKNFDGIDCMGFGN